MILIAKLNLNNITKTFGKGEDSLNALENLNLTIEDQELCCIIGPSGCGKSTLLRIIGGFIGATEGKAEIGGVEIKGPDIDRGIVFQEYALFPWKNVIQNVEFGLKMKNVPKTERRSIALRYLKMVELEEFEKTATYNLSGGMKQRVAIARALANDPLVLSMDEPFGALDALTREAMEIELIKIWQKTNKTIVFITHDVEEAVFLASKLVVMTARPGKVNQIFDLSFSKNFKGDLKEARKLKTQKEFIDIRTHALSLIWGES